MSISDAPNERTKGLYIKVSEEWWNDLDTFCKTRGLSKTSVLEKGFELYKGKAEAMEALAKKEGL